MNQILEGYGRRPDAYQRDYDSSVSGMGRPHDHRGLDQELAHERNNYAVAINGRTWKVFADQRQAQNIARSLQAKGKDATVQVTGLDPTEGVAEALAAKIAELSEMITSLKESATAGATSSGNIATVVNPHLSPGKARGMKSFTGSPGKSGTKSPPQPKPKNNTGVNGLDVKSVSIFGGPKAR